MKKIIQTIIFVATGIINILVGSCGGIVAIKGLKYKNIEQTKSHATAISIILPLSIISAISYIVKKEVSISESYVYLVPGLIGSAIGSWLLPRISNRLLSIIFSIFIIYAGTRMLIK